MISGNHLLGLLLIIRFLIDFLTADEYLRFIAQLSNISNEQLENHLTFFSRFIGTDIWGTNMLIRNLSAGNKQKG